MIISYNEQLIGMSDENFEAMAAQMASGMVLNETKKKLLRTRSLKPIEKLMFTVIQIY